MPGRRADDALRRSDQGAEDVLGDLVGQRDPGGLGRALADGDHPAVLAVHAGPRSPGSSRRTVSRLSASWSTWTGSPIRRTSTVSGVVAGQLGQGVQAGAEVLGRLVVAELVEARGWGCRRASRGGP